MTPNLAPDGVPSLTPAAPGRTRRANLSNSDEPDDRDRRAGRTTADAPESGEPVRDTVRRSPENRRSDLTGTVRGQSDRSVRYLYRTCARQGCRNPVPNRYGPSGSPLCPACRESTA